MTELAEDEIPRTDTLDMDGSDLTVKYDPTAHTIGVVISDGTRFAIYLPMANGDEVDVTSHALTIVPGYVEAGRFKEANVITLTDGGRKARYVPAGKA